MSGINDDGIDLCNSAGGSFLLGKRKYYQAAAEKAGDSECPLILHNDKAVWVVLRFTIFTDH